MTSGDYSIIAFALFNGARVLAYLPQIVRISRDPNGATAVSLTTWSLFTAANLATISHAVTVSGDLLVAGVFGLNAIGCLIIVGLTTAKRFRLDHQLRLQLRLAPITSQVRSGLSAIASWRPRVGRGQPTRAASLTPRHLHA
jgi:hypothetical protein